METFVCILQIRRSLLSSLFWDPKLLRAKSGLKLRLSQLPRERLKARQSDCLGEPDLAPSEEL